MYSTSRLTMFQKKADFEQTKENAEKGRAGAQYNLGIMYTNGLGVSKDDVEACAWYRKAADQGHTGAQYNLGVMYDKGYGVPQDYVEACAWYRKAADQGHAQAQDALSNGAKGFGCSVS